MHAFVSSPQTFLSLSRTLKLCGALSDNEKIQLGSDKEFLSTLVRSLYQKYLDAYMERERRHLKHYCVAQLDRFYDAKGHQKRQMQAGGYVN